VAFVKLISYIVYVVLLPCYLFPLPSLASRLQLQRPLGVRGRSHNTPIYRPLRGGPQTLRRPPVAYSSPLLHQLVKLSVSLLLLILREQRSISNGFCPGGIRRGGVLIARAGFTALTGQRTAAASHNFLLKLSSQKTHYLYYFPD